MAADAPAETNGSSSGAGGIDRSASSSSLSGAAAAQPGSPDDASSSKAAAGKRPHRTYARRSCLSCREKKTRCELPDIYVESNRDVALPAEKRCHRCSVLQLECVVWDGDRKRIRKLPEPSGEWSESRPGLRPATDAALAALAASSAASSSTAAARAPPAAASTASPGPAQTQGMDEQSVAQTVRNILFLPRPIEDDASERAEGSSSAGRAGKGKGTSRSLVRRGEARPMQDREVILSAWHPYILMSQLIHRMSTFGRDIGLKRTLSAPLSDPTDLVDETLSGRLDSL